VNYGALVAVERAMASYVSEMADALNVALLLPLRVPARAVKDLDAIAAAVSSIERLLHERLDDRPGGPLARRRGANQLPSVDAHSARLNEQFATMQETLEAVLARLNAVEVGLESAEAAVHAEIGSLRPPLNRLADDVAGATKLLPDDEDNDGPMSRLRDAITPG
jgi:hypothetical protein